MSDAAIGHAPPGYSVSPPPPPPKQADDGSIQDHAPPVPPPPRQSGAADGQEYHHGQQVTQAAQQIELPGVGWLPPGLSDYSVQDLHGLLKDAQLQASFIANPPTSHPCIAQSQQPLKALLEANIAVSESLLALEAQVLAQREATQSRLLALRALEQQHRTKVAETEKELAPFSPMALYQRLNASIIEQDSLLRGIEESFLDESGIASDKEVQDFIRSLREAKRLAFLRHERKQRWDEARVGGWR